MSHSVPERGDARAAVRIRPGVPDDAFPASRLLTAALAHLAAAQGRRAAAPAPELAAPVLRHLAEAYPGGFWVAVDGERLVGFAAGARRGPVWHLGGLFVQPEYQGAGLGRRLLERALPEPGSVSALTVVSSGWNPVSNSLYAHHAVYPWQPVMYMEAPLPLRLPAVDLAGLEPAPLAAGDLAEVGAIDAGVTGVDRAADHAWMLGRGCAGWVFRRDRRAVAYAFLGGDGTMGSGQVGPVAALEAADVRPVLAFALAHLGGDAERAVLAVPGASIEAQRLLWGCGFTFQGVVALLGASRPFGGLDGYTLAGDALL